MRRLALICMFIGFCFWLAALMLCLLARGEDAGGCLHWAPFFFAAPICVLLSIPALGLSLFTPAQKLAGAGASLAVALYLLPYADLAQLFA